jgi:ATP-dependent DNA helicase RecG
MREHNLPISVETLLKREKIESDRIEFKSGWNPDSIYRSICAFANDIDNIGGGYILIGVEERDGRATRPVKGVDEETIGTIQRAMIGYNNLIRPPDVPRLAVENIDDKSIVVLWVPGGLDRPYEVPETITAKKKHFKFYIRRYTNSVEAKGHDKSDLLSLAKKIPFDDRVHQHGKVEDINLIYIQDYLRLSGSRLFEQMGEISATTLLQQLDLVGESSGVERVKNVALILFSDAPEKFFPYSYIDIVHFRGNTYGREFSVMRCSGPMHLQIKQALDYLRTNVIQEKVTKIRGQAEAFRAWSYPFDALEEAVVNAVYHRDYAEREPITIRVESDNIKIYNCGGPDRSIKLEDLQKGTAVASRYRNRRLGDFLKEMDLSEGRSTGLSLIHAELARNGSPKPLIETDEERSFFRVTFFIHPVFDSFKWGVREPQLSLTQKLNALTGGSDRAEKMATLLMMVRNRALGRRELLREVGLTNHTENARSYIAPLEAAGLIEKTLPDKPTSPKQRYKITTKGIKFLVSLD